MVELLQVPSMKFRAPHIEAKLIGAKSRLFYRSPRRNGRQVTGEIDILKEFRKEQLNVLSKIKLESFYLRPSGSKKNSTPEFEFLLDFSGKPLFLFGCS